MQINGNAINMDDGHTIALPKYPTASRVKVWAVPVDYRADGLFVAVTVKGEPEEIPACNLADCTVIGELDYPADDNAALEVVRAQRLAALHEAVDAAAAELTADVSQTERQTWPTQLAEALELGRYGPDTQPDYATVAPLLTLMAAQRGLGETVPELAARVLAAAARYTAAAGPLVAWGQRTEWALVAAADAEALMSVSITPPTL